MILEFLLLAVLGLVISLVLPGIVSYGLFKLMGSSKKLRPVRFLSVIPLLFGFWMLLDSMANPYQQYAKDFKDLAGFELPKNVDVISADVFDASQLEPELIHPRQSSISIIKTGADFTDSLPNLFADTELVETADGGISDAQFMEHRDAIMARTDGMIIERGFAKIAADSKVWGYVGLLNDGSSILLYKHNH